MCAKDFSSYQKNIVKNYYDNLDAIMLGKLQELVTELYLAQSKAKQDKLWDKVGNAMIKLKIPPKIANNIMKMRSTEILAKNLSDWLKN